MRIAVAGIVGGALLITGCATSSDPHEGGFFGGVQGLSSGAYEQRAREREERLQRLRDEKRALDDESRELQQRDQRMTRKLASEKRRLHKLSGETRQLSGRIAGLKREGKASALELKRLEKRLAALKRGIASTSHSLDALEGGGGGASALDRRRTALRAQRKALEKEYQMLLDLTLQLGQ